MITMTTVAVVPGTRLRTGYVAPSAQPGGERTWQKLFDFVINNSTGVSEVECRRR
jgi:hypothetical protein